MTLTSVVEPSPFSAHEREAGAAGAKAKVGVAEVAKELAIRDADAVDEGAADKDGIAGEKLIFGS